MHGNGALRTCLAGLVLLNLVFVQLTDATSLAWLVPLYVLTLLSPLLARFQESLLYRVLWNAGVLGVFTVLLRHATGDELRYVLEDGLVLAALCQVHLLNNLRAQQRPDLLFLNSFLIAIITGYMCQDLAYPVAFLAFVPIFVIALQLQCVRSDGGNLDRATTARVVRDGLGRATVLLLLTVFVFLFWPRDFSRRGYLAGELDFATQSESLEIGFTDTLELRRQGLAQASNRVVMRVTQVSGPAGAVPARWRGATLAATDAERWWPLRASAAPGSDATWAAADGALIRELPPAEGAHARVRVELPGGRPGPLFTPLLADRVGFGRAASGQHVAVANDATLRIDSTMPTPTVYELSIAPERIDLGGLLPATLAGRPVEPFIVLPEGNELRAAVNLAAKLARELPDEVEQHQLVRHFSNYLGTRHQYGLPAADGAARSLEDFLSGSPGHCEFFASALASMLRTRGVPCRIATGYMSSEWDPETSTLTFRERNAHAWVEVFDPEAGWYTVDPTPAAAMIQQPSLLARLEGGFAALWAQVSGFDSERRAELFAWMRGLPARGWQRLRAYPLASMTALAAIALAAWCVRRWRRRRVPEPVRLYRRALRRAGLQLDPGETPRELLERAREGDLAPARFDELEQVTSMHEQHRYAA